jgi:hypothetical protein
LKAIGSSRFEGFKPEDGDDAFLRNVLNYLQGVITQNTSVDIFTAVRTSDFTFIRIVYILISPCISETSPLSG